MDGFNYLSDGMHFPGYRTIFCQSLHEHYESIILDVMCHLHTEDRIAVEKSQITGEVDRISGNYHSVFCILTIAGLRRFNIVCVCVSGHACMFQVEDTGGALSPTTSY